MVLEIHPVIFCNKKQYVVFNDSPSSLSNIHTGIQGSILGSLLFLIYINDLPRFANKFKVIMYAHDTTLHGNIVMQIKLNLLGIVFNNKLTSIYIYIYPENIL